MSGNTTDEQFKKTTQQVNPSVVTDHNINDEYMKNPPDNLGAATELPATARQSRGLKEGAQITEDDNPGVIGHQDGGRAKKSDVEGSIVQESSIHS